jgi:hypothetical protein
VANQHQMMLMAVPFLHRIPDRIRRSTATTSSP